EPIRRREQVRALRVPDPRESVPFVLEILRRLRAELAAEAVPVLGFAGAPFTLAAYLVEGQRGRDFEAVRQLAHARAELLRDLLERLAELVVGYLRAQVEAGAQAVQLFDTWAGLLDRDAYRAWVLPLHQRIAKELDRARAPLILYVKDGAHLVDLMAESGADVVSPHWRPDPGPGGAA